jgi:hypothetical protein
VSKQKTHDPSQINQKNTNPLINHNWGSKLAGCTNKIVNDTKLKVAAHNQKSWPDEIM